MRAEFFGRLRDLAHRAQACRSRSACCRRRVTATDWRDQLDLIDSTAQAGGQMWAQAHAREFSVMLSWKTRAPVRQPARVAGGAGPAARRAGARAFRDPDLRRRLVQAAHEGDYGRAIGAETRKPNYDWIRILERPAPAEPDGGRAGRRARPGPGRRDDRSGAGDELRAVLRADHRQPRPRAPAVDHEAPAGARHVLRFGRAREPDHGQLVADPPAGALGARPRGVHPGGGGAQPDVRAGDGVEASPTGASCGRASSPTST